jgi:hypothetical protein
MWYQSGDDSHSRTSDLTESDDALMTHQKCHRYAGDTKRKKVTIEALCEMAAAKSTEDFLVKLITRSTTRDVRPAVQASDGDEHHVLTL